MNGPYEAEADAGRAAAGTGQDNHTLLTGACADAGVTVGAHDARIIRWLAIWKPSTIAVICGLISRAHQADQALTAEHERDRAATCPDCDAHPAELCGGASGGWPWPTGMTRWPRPCGCAVTVGANGQAPLTRHPVPGPLALVSRLACHRVTQPARADHASPRDLRGQPVARRARALGFTESAQTLKATSTQGRPDRRV